MIASQFFDLFELRAGAIVSRAKLPFITNLVQNAILGEDHPIMRVQPDPYFTTTAAVYSYSANDVLRSARDVTPGDLVGDVRSIPAKSIYAPESQITQAFLNDNPLVYPDWVSFGVKRDRLIARYACVQSSSPERGDCRIEIKQPHDLGDTTVTWRAVAYLWPTQITDEDDLITIPDDFVDDLLLTGVLRFMEGQAYGLGQTEEDPYQRALRRFRNKYNSAAVQEETNITPNREC